ncbi:MAG TPA: anaerobic ribonucleoside-triphosphate reductase activating protein [Synergistaceae bacterium]|jgi:pyruvate formate lyase activating enzyme|nr:MAG: Anaerobic ribonucleoside-triphosphate reductase activating protein [Synergistales bacterium 57_84]HBG15125.1 anaerobic ribonucleoside-triphosphate reductase activating protein [Synergistaceae bacterium]
MTGFLVPLGGYLRISFIDWTGHVAPVLFLCGCNYRCPYCHNPELVTLSAGRLPVLEVLEDIRQRSGFLDGVVVSGGEPTVHDRLPEFLSALKNRTGLRIKLDTNGSRPWMLGSLVTEGLVDSISMDVKAPWDRYPRITGHDGEPVRESLEILSRSGIPHEARTTFVPDLMTLEDLEMVREQIPLGVPWIIQTFRGGKTLDPSLEKGALPDREGLKFNFPDAIIR